ncbi:ankyrin repeat domain-containing protein [Endozoicomonas sp. YOMI1]|uniref:ankyrin repeat domain-containing protein n=1 Tax=Endozoicomonas sp. YOMI1 TaxID=2828739 RepID=UPI0021487B44|nr:ankyrin repeat domain-containing protein [Endozoicomonas sp. YOMI1]
MESISRYFSYQRLDTRSSAISGASRDNPYNEPAPVAACRVGDLGCLEREIQKDRSIINRDYLTVTTGDKFSLLVIALAGRHVELARLLINEGADVNYATKKNGETPLTYAVGNGLIEIVRLLIDKGAYINQAAKDGATPLYIAAEEGNNEIVELLLANDADPKKKLKKLSIGRFSLLTKSPIRAAQHAALFNRGDKETVKMIKAALEGRKINPSSELPPLLAGQHASYGSIR